VHLLWKTKILKFYGVMTKHSKSTAYVSYYLLPYFGLEEIVKVGNK